MCLKKTAGVRGDFFSYYLSVMFAEAVYFILVSKEFQFWTLGMAYGEVQRRTKQLGHKNVLNMYSSPYIPFIMSPDLFLSSSYVQVT